MFIIDWHDSDRVGIANKKRLCLTEGRLDPDLVDREEERGSWDKERQRIVRLWCGGFKSDVAFKQIHEHVRLLAV
jgi:hypothetical protein